LKENKKIVKIYFGDFSEESRENISQNPSIKSMN